MRECVPVSVSKNNINCLYEQGGGQITTDLTRHVNAVGFDHTQSILLLI